MIQLFYGDCLDIMPTLPAQSVDAIITDLPYGTTACKWDTIIPFAPMWEAVKHVLKPKGAFITTASQPFTSALIMSNPKWFRYEWIWEKPKATLFLSAKKQPLKAHENIIVFCDGSTLYNPQMTKGKMHKSGRKNTKEYSEVYGSIKDTMTERDDYYPRSVLQIKHEIKPTHPTQKPVALYEYLIKTYTHEGDTVLDMAFGSCTTGEACINTGRNFIGIEKDEKYFQIGKNRLGE